MVLEKVPYQVPRLPVLFYWAIGAVLMFALEISNSASPEFSGLVALFTFLTGCAIQAFGGLTSLFGICTLVFALQHVLISQIIKAFLRQPPEWRLQVPIVTMAAYCVGVAALGFGGYLARYLKFNKGRAFYAPIVDASTLRTFAMVTIVLAAFRTVIVTIFGYDAATQGLATGGIFGILRQLTFFDTLAVAAATGAIIIGSNGKRSMGALNLVPLAIPMMMGFIGASRSQIGFAALGYVAGALAFGFRFRLQHYVMGAVFFYVMQFIIGPYSLAARYQVRTSDFGKNIQRSFYLLGDVVANPGKYSEASTVAESHIPVEFKMMRYYPFPSNTLERYAILKSDDAIIAATVYRGTMGMRTIIPGFEMLPPSWLYDDKPTIATANMLAHRTKGLVTDDDMVTGITLGWVCDCFSAFKWWGIALIPIFVGLGYSVMYGWVFKPDMRRNAIAVGMLPALMNVFSEGTIQVHIVNIFQGSIVTFVGLGILLFCTRLWDATHVRRKASLGIPAMPEQPA